MRNTGDGVPYLPSANPSAPADQEWVEAPDHPDDPDGGKAMAQAINSLDKSL